MPLIYSLPCSVTAGMMNPVISSNCFNGSGIWQEFRYLYGTLRYTVKLWSRTADEDLHYRRVPFPRFPFPYTLAPEALQLDMKPHLIFCCPAPFQKQHPEPCFRIPDKAWPEAQALQASHAPTHGTPWEGGLSPKSIPKSVARVGSSSEYRAHKQRPLMNRSQIASLLSGLLLIETCPLAGQGCLRADVATTSFQLAEGQL